ncbi:Trimethyllysine dioxygenase, mitochondrial [Strongyloides ratti]|uniref:Trimethyllysine dioxygenase, mitochondrial n=1 Tax=Strongyloides ratti TaxID=34506 RepID=A0A090LHF6_STRRB|nr:Trimethyllysine dioxygenase, mitochondrial [Strongyloides ratti]CEF66940.1 Trimethyllysine dioxygenase, mitochondrial [Strongyloides ratti]
MFVIKKNLTFKKFFSTTNILLKKFNNINICDNKKGIQLENQDGEIIKIPLIWLRDHCKSEKSYTWKTFQKNVILNDLWKQSEINNNSDIKFDKENQKIFIKWKDGHKSEYDIKSILKSNTYKNNQIPEKILWNKKLFISNSKPLSYNNLDVREFYKEFFKYGLVFINDVPYHDSKYTKELCEKIACIQNTLFGSFWVFSNSSTNKDEVHADTAYTSTSIGLHTDGTYFQQTPGIQVLHCLQKSKSGGENILTDGFYCAQNLNKKYPTYYKFLSNNKFYHHYKELPSDNTSTGYHSVNYSNIIETSNDEIKQIRFNPYDRMDITIGRSEEDYNNLMIFYQSYTKFNEILNDEDNTLEISLNPGTVMFMDNKRILHARKEFEGKRIMCGAYLNYDDMVARANSLFEGNKIEYL